MINKTNKVLALISCLSLSTFCGLRAAEETGSSSHPAPVLSFSSGGKFKIVQFTDTHLSEEASDDKQNTSEQKKLCAERLEAELLAQLSRIADQEKPDLVVFTGDTVGTNYRQPFALWTRLTAPLASRRIPWAVVLGNHDTEFTGQSQAETMKFLSTLPYSLARPGDVDAGGDGNYVLSIFDSSSSKAKMALYFLGYSDEKTAKDLCGSYAWLTSKQINWFRNQTRELASANNGVPVPSLLFLHVPIPEYHQTVAEEKKIGKQKDGISTPKINSGMFAAILETRAVMGVFAGHDHDNDFALGHFGVCLAYGRKTGNFSYHHLTSGARVIELQEGVYGFTSWIRDADGAEESHFTFPSDLVTPKK